MIRYTCQNFANKWDKFPECVKELLNIIIPEEEYKYVGMQDKPDISFLAPFHTEILDLSIPMCYIIHENIYLDWMHYVRNVVKNLNIPIIGYINDTENTCEYPHWLYKYN